MSSNLSYSSSFGICRLFSFYVGLYALCNAQWHITGKYSTSACWHCYFPHKNYVITPLWGSKIKYDSNHFCFRFRFNVKLCKMPFAMIKRRNNEKLSLTVFHKEEISQCRQHSFSCRIFRFISRPKIRLCCWFS